MNTYTSYQQHIRKCFADAYHFFDNHKQPRTDNDWERVVKDIVGYDDPLTKELLMAVVNELEREYNASRLKE